MASNCPSHFQSLSAWGLQRALHESPVPQLSGEITQLPVPRRLAQRTPLTEGQTETCREEGPDQRLEHMSDARRPRPGGRPRAPLAYTAPRTCQDTLPNRQGCKTRDVRLARPFRVAVDASESHLRVPPPQAVPRPVAGEPASSTSCEFCSLQGFQKSK